MNRRVAKVAKTLGTSAKIWGPDGNRREVKERSRNDQLSIFRGAWPLGGDYRGDRLKSILSPVKGRLPTTNTPALDGI